MDSGRNAPMSPPRPRRGRQKDADAGANRPDRLPILNCLPIMVHTYGTVLRRTQHYHCSNSKAPNVPMSGYPVITR